MTSRDTLRSRGPTGRAHAHTAVRRGATFVEIVVSTALVGVVLVGALETVGMAYRARRLNASRGVGPELVLELMSEIVAMPYEDPDSPGGQIGLESGESAGNRLNFDDVDDYNNWNASPPQNKSGVSHPGFNGWQRSVRVFFINPHNPGNVVGSDMGVKRIDVTATPPSGSPILMSVFRGRHGSLEQAPATDMTAINWVGALLEVEGATQPLRIGAPPSNQSYDAN